MTIEQKIKYRNWLEMAGSICAICARLFLAQDLLIPLIFFVLTSLFFVLSKMFANSTKLLLLNIVFMGVDVFNLVVYLMRW